MQRHLWATPREQAGRRLDRVLATLLPLATHAEACRLLRTGLVRLNGAKAKPGTRVEAGDEVAVPPWTLAALGAEGAVAATEEAAASEQAQGAGEVPTAPHHALRAPYQRSLAALPRLEVAYEDQDILLAIKPAHLASHGGIGHGEDNLALRLEAHCQRQGVCEHTPGLAQRLDCGVSGLVACGKHPAALKGLMGPPHGPPLIKVYLAVVAGTPEQPAGSITLPLRVTDQPRGDAPKTVVDRVAGVAARTDYVVLARTAACSLLAIRLITGRTHQIRAHLRGIGTPLVGDARYGQPLLNEHARATWGTHRPLLHAALLRVCHPMNKEQWPQAFAPAPKDMDAAMGQSVDAAFVAAAGRGELSVLSLLQEHLAAVLPAA